jgi:hypothetical protein
MTNVLPICITAINILFVIKFYRCIPVFILFTFFFLYTRTFNYYLIDNISISNWTDFQTKDIILKVLIIHGLFLFFLGNFIPSGISSGKKINYLDIFKPNRLIFFVLLFFSLMILIFGLTGQSLLDGGSYGNLDGGAKSTFFEYFILLYFFLIIYAPRKKFYKATIYILFIMYILKNLLYGGRIEVVEISLLLFFLIYVLNQKISIYTTIIIIISGIYLNTVVQNIRSNPINFFSGGDVSQFFNPSSLIVNNSNIDHIDSNEGDVIQSSARVIGLIEKSEIKTSQRVYAFVFYLISPLMPSSILPEYTNLAAYKQDKYRSGGGGLISVYFFLWMGYLGPIFIGIILALLIKYFYISRSKYVFVYVLCILITFPRWFAYNPIFLVKFCFYSILILFILKLVIQITNKYFLKILF